MYQYTSNPHKPPPVTVRCCKVATIRGRDPKPFFRLLLKRLLDQCRDSLRDNPSSPQLQATKTELWQALARLQSNDTVQSCAATTSHASSRPNSAVATGPSTPDPAFAASRFKSSPPSTRGTIKPSASRHQNSTPSTAHATPPAPPKDFTPTHLPGQGLHQHTPAPGSLLQATTNSLSNLMSMTA